MIKTVNRQPYLFDTRAIKEKHFNFVEFNGLCDNKNYLGIDQNTFSEVDNMYLDQDRQLSSRPPIRKIDVLVDQEVIKIYKVNTIIFYHTTDGEKFYINFKYKDEWYSREVTENINIAWFDERYVIFTENDIISFEFVYASNDPDPDPDPDPPIIDPDPDPDPDPPIIDPEPIEETITLLYEGDVFDVTDVQMQAAPEPDPVYGGDIPPADPSEAQALEYISIPLEGTLLDGVETDDIINISMEGYWFNDEETNIPATAYFIQDNILNIQLQLADTNEWYRFHNQTSASDSPMEYRKSKVFITYTILVGTTSNIQPLRMTMSNTTEEKIRWYTAEETIYIPITENVLGGETSEPESKNVLTGSRRVRYTFDSSLVSDTGADGNLNGKLVKILMNGKEYEIIWRPNNDKVFVSNIGQINADLLQVASNGTMLAVSPARDRTRMYYSFDGSLFYTIDTGIEEDDWANFANIIFADDGSAAYHLRLKDSETLELRTLIFTGVSGPDDLNNLLWSSVDIDVRPADYDTNLWGGGYIGGGNNKEMSSTRWNFTLNAGQSFSYAGHSPETGKFVAMLPAKSSFRNVNNIGDTFNLTPELWWKGVNISESPVEESGSAEASLLLIADLAMFPPVIKVHPIHKSFNIGTAGLDRNYAKIRLIEHTRPNLTINTYIYFSQLGGGDGMFICSGNYDMYYSISSEDRTLTRTIYKSSIVPNVNWHGFPLPPSSMKPFYAHDISVKSNEEGIILFHAGGTSDKRDIIWTHRFSADSLTAYWPNDYKEVVVYTGSTIDDEIYNRGNRGVFPWRTINKASTSTQTGTFTTQSGLYKLDRNGNLLTDRYLYYASSVILLLGREELVVDDVANTIPLFIDGDTIIYMDTQPSNGLREIYSNVYDGLVHVDLTIEGNHRYIVPSHIARFLTNVISLDNKAYITSAREGQVYLPEIDTLKFPDEITALANFTQTSLGIFLENEVFELLWDMETGSYYLSRTKLQLGCRKGSEVLLDYDGKTIFITTLKGLNALNYQDFVQSTEHVYNYLTERMMSTYDKYAASPIKLTQYKNWLFMYRTDAKHLYMFDVRNSSWWKWTNVSDIQQIIFDGRDLLIVTQGIVYRYDFNFDGENYYDDVGIPIEWSCTSQRLHFGAPNNYKHIRSFSIITSQSHESVLRCGLRMKCYHNLQNLTDTEIVEYKLDQLTTAIYRVNFIKLNAFQFTIHSDKRDKERREFVTPDIAIKYRVTEGVR